MADANTVKSEDLAKTSAVFFAESFKKNIDVLLQALGLTRKIEKKAGQVVKTYKVTGTLESGKVGEGEEIPLSHFKTEVEDIFEVSYEKYRKRTTFEAIAEKGYEQAVRDTDSEMLRQVQGGIRKQFFDFVKTGTGAAAGTTLRDTLAQVRAQLVLKTEDYGLGDGDFIYMVNPLDTADYLGKEAVHTVQNVFGLNYLKGFLNLYDVIERSDIPQGTVIATTRNNLIMYYVDISSVDLSQVFDFVSDETGYVGVAHSKKLENLTTDTVVVTGIGFFAELIDWVVKGTIGGGAAAAALSGDFPVDDGLAACADLDADDIDLEDMTVAQLKAFAGANEISIKGCEKKADILEAIVAAGETAAA
ncbi:hypothetical protein [Adlercreutzia caecimuris]|uniref:hypothetical protein n=1 Tax=Adlercreutzia caecimuris TaxID=671266 RepID=UPI00272C7440|nr:hypothetical protein [Adlercreutzia caecimuris]